MMEFKDNIEKNTKILHKEREKIVNFINGV